MLCGEGQAAILTEGGELLAVTPLAQDLYTLDPTLHHHAHLACGKVGKPLELWHRRLGHLGEASVRRFASLGEVTLSGDPHATSACVECAKGRLNERP